MACWYSVTVNMAAFGLYVITSVKISKDSDFFYLLKLYLYFSICLKCQRALLEQKQKKKRQEPLMVQSNVDGRSRTRRAKQSEEQAPLVESYLSSNSSTIYHGKACTPLWLC